MYLQALFHWLNGFLWMGYKKPLELSDLGEIPWVGTHVLTAAYALSFKTGKIREKIQKRVLLSAEFLVLLENILIKMMSNQSVYSIY